MKNHYPSAILVLSALLTVSVFMMKPDQMATAVYRSEEPTESHFRFPEDSFQYSRQQFYSILNRLNQLPADNDERSINSWQYIGPDTMVVNDSLHFCGRARWIQLFSPQRVIDMGIRVSTGSGGLWNMTKDGDGKVTAVSMQGNLPVQDIGCFAIHPSNPNIMYVGTGEPGTGGTGESVGLFKTTDGGITWNVLDTPYISTKWFHKILINPLHPDTILAASENGLYYSNDGGNLFNRVINGDVTDVVFSTSNPDTVYATRMGMGMFLSTSGGTNFFTGTTPMSPWGHVALAVAPSASNVLYLSNVSGLNETHIYKSTDYGGSWNRCPVTNFLGMVDTFSIHWNQGYYNNCITIHPTNPNIVIVGAGDVTRTDNGFNFLEGQGTDGHHDHHWFEWQADGTLLDANDGGLFVSSDNGVSFKSTINYLPVAQFYEADMCDNYSPSFIGSLQDNGTVIRKFDLPSLQWQWKQVAGGDGFSSGINPNYEADVTQNNNSPDLESFNSGSSWGNIFVIPGFNPTGYFFPRYERSTMSSTPAKNGVWVKGSKQLFKRDSLYNWAAVNNGNEFTSDIWHYALGNRTTVNQLQNVLVSMPATDNNKVYVRDRNNTGWYNITNNLPKSGMEAYRVSTAYYNNDVLYTFSVTGTTMGRVFMNTDIGITDWVDITGNLPVGIRINSLCNNPYNPNEIFIGTYRFGVFRTIVGTGIWTRYNNGWDPGMDITSLEFADSTTINGKLVLIATSYGRGIWQRDISGEEPSALQRAAVINFDLKNFPVTKYGDEIPVRFQLENDAAVRIELSDMNGALRQTVCNQNLTAGSYFKPIVGEFASGIYLCCMTVNNRTRITKKLVVVN